MRILMILALALLAAAALLYFRSGHRTADSPQSIQAEAARSTATSNEPVKEVPPAAVQREALASSPAAGFRTGQLVVHVRHKATRTPVADVKVKVSSSGPPADPSSSQLQLAEEIASGRTDSAGDVVIGVRAAEPTDSAGDVTPGIRWDEALMVEAELPGRAPKCETAFGVAGIAAGGRSEIEILLPDENDARVFGQVLSAETNAPLAGARVELRNPEGAADRGRAVDTTGADGKFEIPFSTWAYPHLRIEAQGCGARLANPAGHDDPARPLLVRLARTCTLEVDARDPAGAPVAKVQVLLTAKSAALDVAANEASGFFMRAYLYAPDESWNAETGADGRATIMGLPAGVELHGL